MCLLSPIPLRCFAWAISSAEGGVKEDNSPVFVPRKYGKNLEKYFLHPGDVTIAMTDMKDRVAILGNTAWIRDAGRFVVNQRVGCMRVKRPDLLEPRFFYFYSNCSPHVDYLRSRANSGVQVNLSTSAIKESELTLPPLAEQKAIAAVLEARGQGGAVVPSGREEKSTLMLMNARAGGFPSGSGRRGEADVGSAGRTTISRSIMPSVVVVEETSRQANSLDGSRSSEEAARTAYVMPG